MAGTALIMTRVSARLIELAEKVVERWIGLGFFDERRGSTLLYPRPAPVPSPWREKAACEAGRLRG